MKKLILTCEHYDNKIPYQYKKYFTDKKEILKTHEGYDIGVNKIFKSISKIADNMFNFELSRLLIDANRSINHPKLFSLKKGLISSQEKKTIIDKYFLPYRESIRSLISRYIEQDHSVIHISVHTFTPVLNDKIRDADIGILFDPSRKNEKVFFDNIKDFFSSNYPDYKVRANYPYKGKNDGLTSFLRKQFKGDNYSGIEIEVNQIYFSDKNKNADKLCKALVKGLSDFKARLSVI